ncbi:MAG: MlaD family protein, partial [Steroidobacteraceae bacterium]
MILGLAALFFLTTQLPSGGLKLSFGKAPGYDVTAEFDNIGDLKVGAPVRMAGVRIGDVTGIG